MQEDLGKKLYTSRSFWIFKILYLSVAALLLFNLLLQTFYDPTFVNNFNGTFSDVLSFHLKYPQEIIIYILTIFFPALYYSFFRSLRFYETAIIMNRGLPYFNRVLPYNSIDSYKLIHPKYLMGVKRSDCNDEFVFTIKDHDRAIAIFDQHGIKGDLGNTTYQNTVTTSKKLLVFFLGFSALMFIVQYFGLVGYFLR